jgi:hypothetical protein
VSEDVDFAHVRSHKRLGEPGYGPDVDVEQLVELETQVWRALVDGDPAADQRLLSHDFVGVYPTGFAGRDEHVAQIAHQPTVARFEITEPRAFAVAEDAWMLMYRAVSVRPGADAVEESMYVSSLWCRRGDRWVNVFSQDTPDTGVAVV